MLPTATFFHQASVRLICFTLCGLFFSPLLYGQAKDLPVGGELDRVILAMDSVFWEAYNTCDVEKMMSFVADDIEFYHDKGGLTEGRTQLHKAMAEGLCRNGANEVERHPEVATIKVFPLAGVGAILKGQHTFRGVAHPGEDGIAYFFHLWEKRAEGWKMTRVFSYDHAPLAANRETATITLLPTQLAQFTGVYAAPQTGKVLIQSNGTGLELVRGEKVMQLYPKSATVFFHRELPLEFEFVLNEQGDHPTKFSVRQSGKVVEEASWVSRIGDEKD